VGIGTETPATRLEITSEAETGAFRFDPDQQQHPALEICNLKSGHSFTLGASDSQAVLITDAPGGFRFTAAHATDIETSPDINTERLLVNLSPAGNGRMGVGRVPRDYELDVQGIVQAMMLYQDTNAEQVRDVKPLTPVLAKLQQLQPMTFEWKADTARSEPVSSSGSLTASDSESPTASSSSSSMPDTNTVNLNQRIGLLAEQVGPIFPEVVKTASDGSQSVAYTSLVPVLIQAINELNHQHRMEKRRLENLISQLGNRIAFLSILLVSSWVLTLLGSWLF
jgi:Chaperone of endosialidase